LLDDSWNIKVADFGFATIVSGYNETQLGTPNYMAPEILD